MGRELAWLAIASAYTHQICLPHGRPPPLAGNYRGSNASAFRLMTSTTRSEMTLPPILSEFLNWWTNRMLELVPPTILNRTVGPADACVISAEESATSVPSTIQIAMRRAGRESMAGRFVLDAPGMAEAQLILRKLRRSHAIAVRVPGDLLLERPVVLPLAAEADVTGLLRYEMERITPFASDELFWTWSVTRRDRERRRLHVHLALVPKAALRTLSAALEGLQVAPSWLEAARQGGTPCVIPLGHMAESERRSRRRQRLAFAGTGGLMVAAIALPFILQFIALGKVEEQMRALEPRVQLSETLRQRIASYSSGATLVAAERSRGGDPLAVLAVVTAALPDDTFLSDLGLRQGKLEISGESKAAARLIAALAANPTIKDPAFVSSVTRAENGLDAFTIRADVAR
jgi:general secretion pathway protein L